MTTSIQRSVFRADGRSGGAAMALTDVTRGAQGRLLVLYGRFLGLLLTGYLLFDKAFAYLHIPGTPVYVGELVLIIGGVGTLAATRYLSDPIREEPILALLITFVLWGTIRLLPGVGTYGIYAIRDSALWYYCLFALFAIAALARSPDLLGRLAGQFDRLVPLLLLWLPVAVILTGWMSSSGPRVPFTTVSVMMHKTEDAAIAALLALGWLRLFPDRRTAGSRGAWSVVALIAIALAATQNRSGLLGAVAGAAVGFPFLRNRLRLIVQAIVVAALGLSTAALLSLQLPAAGVSANGYKRMFSVSQLIDNVASIGGVKGSAILTGTVAVRETLWSRTLHIQIANGSLLDGAGFGPNLAYEAGVYDTNQSDPLRSPHNSHLDVLARMGLVGLSMWVALWSAWYWRIITGCRRLARCGQHDRQKIAVLCMMTTTAFLVSSFFDPQLEGAQVAALVWTAFGVGVAVTSLRRWPSESISSVTEMGGRIGAQTPPSARVSD